MVSLLICAHFRSRAPVLIAFYSITSSARASNVGGTSMPSALAVLRLIASSYLGGACTARSGSLLALEDTIDVAGCAAVRVDRTRSVGGQAIGDEEAI